ncbi:MAG: AzlC family ABC transporter permease, partial [Actinomycetota bacterium]
DPATWGLDAAFPALFLALLVPQLTTRDARLAALVGAAIALALTPFAPAGVPIIAASAGCLVGLGKTRGSVAA